MCIEGQKNQTLGHPARLHAWHPLITTPTNKLEEQTGSAAVAPVHFHAFKDVAGNVRRQVARIKAHPFVPKHIPVRGFIYDVKTGKLQEVGEERPRTVQKSA